MKQDEYTFDALCQLRGVSRALVESPVGDLTLDERDEWIPRDEIIVGGDLTIKNWKTGCLPPKVIVGGNLRIVNCCFVEFPAYIEVNGDVKIVNSHFESIHEGCHFRQSVSFDSSMIQHIHDDFHVHGDLKLSDCCISVLSKGLVVEGNLDISGTQIKVVPDDCSCRSLNAAYSLVEKLPENWSVNELNLAHCPISELSKGVRVAKVLDISYTAIREIRELLPRIKLYASHSNLSKLPDHSRFEHLELEGCPIAVFPSDFKVLGDLNMKHTNIRSFPDDFEVTGVLDASNSALRYVPDLLVTYSLKIWGTQVKYIPVGVVCRAIYCDKGVRVDAYQFDRKKEFDFHPGGKYVCTGAGFYKINHRSGNILYCSEMGEWGNMVIVSGGDGLFACGATLSLAQADLDYRRMQLGQIDTKNFKIDDTVSFAQALALYRFLTSDYLPDIIDYLECLPEVKEFYTIREWINVMKDGPESKQFRSHFKV